MATAIFKTDADDALIKLENEILKEPGIKNQDRTVHPEWGVRGFSYVATEGALQPVSIDRYTDYYEITLGAMASPADYDVFRIVTLKAVELFSAKVELDSLYTFDTLEKARSFNWQGWIEYTRKENFGKLTDFVRDYGVARTYEGVNTNFSIGPKMLWRLEYDHEKITSVLIEMQRLQREDYSSRTTPDSLLYDEDDVNRFVTLAVLRYNNEGCIVTAKQVNRTPGAFITLRHALYISNEDRSFQSIVRFHHTPKIFPECRLLDEDQVIITHPIEGEYLETLKRNLEIYYESDLFKDYVFPGRGFDEEQRTFIMVWDIDSSPISVEDFRYWIKHIRGNDANWSINTEEEINIGDRWFLVARRGKEIIGIIGSGIFDSKLWYGFKTGNPEQPELSENEGEVKVYCDILANALIDPFDGEVTSGAELQYRFPDIPWSHLQSGTPLPQETAQELENLWAAKIFRLEMSSPSPLFHILKES